jgi:hypothetical protein
MEEDYKPPKWLIPDKAYDVLKWVGLIVCPALSFFMLSLGQTWGIPYAPELAMSISAAGTAIGALIGVSAIKGGGADDQNTKTD